MKLRFEASFVQEALAQESPVRKGISKVVRLAGQLSFRDLLNHDGIHLEKLKDQIDPASGLPLYSLRATRSARIKALMDGDILVLLTIESDHGKAYR